MRVDSYMFRTWLVTSYMRVAFATQSHGVVDSHNMYKDVSNISNQTNKPLGRLFDSCLALCDVVVIQLIHVLE